MEYTALKCVKREVRLSRYVLLLLCYTAKTLNQGVKLFTAKLKLNTGMKEKTYLLTRV
mgnify:CR=1